MADRLFEIERQILAGAGDHERAGQAVGHAVDGVFIERDAAVADDRALQRRIRREDVLPVDAVAQQLTL